MKITVLTVILLVLAVIIAVGSVTVLGPCVHEDGSEAPCTGTGRAILADGILLAVLSVFLLFIKAPKMRLILFMITAVAALTGILMPGTLLPVCKMDTMHCRTYLACYKKSDPKIRPDNRPGSAYGASGADSLRRIHCHPEPSRGAEQSGIETRSGYYCGSVFSTVKDQLQEYAPA